MKLTQELLSIAQAKEVTETNYDLRHKKNKTIIQAEHGKLLNAGYKEMIELHPDLQTDAVVECKVGDKVEYKTLKGEVKRSVIRKMNGDDCITLQDGSNIQKKAITKVLQKESLITQYNRLMAEGKVIAAGRILADVIHEAPEDELLAYFRKGHRVAIGNIGVGNMDEHDRATINKMFERFRMFLMNGDLSGFMNAYADESAKHPDEFDFLMDEVFAAAGVEDIDDLLAKAGIKKKETKINKTTIKEMEDDDELDDDDDNEEDIIKFYVAFYDEEEERAWIGLVTKEGGKWREKRFRGKPDYHWGKSYMSYLKPSDIMSWINKDYNRNIEIEGPFYTASDAEEYVMDNWGKIQESVRRAPQKGTIRWMIAQDKKKQALAPAPEINDERVGNAIIVKFSVIRNGDMMTLTKNGKEVAKFTVQDWKDLVDAVKNKIDGKFGIYRLHHKGDSISISSGGTEVAQISSYDMDKLIRRTKDMEV
jgi:hypothetical protein